MKKIYTTILSLIFTTLLIGQNSQSEIELISDYSSDNTEIKDILHFEGIEYYNLKFIDKDLNDKSYELIVKEFWDGKMVKESTIVNSKDLPIEQYQKVNDSILKLRIISKKTPDNNIKMHIRIGQFLFKREFKSTDSNNYSLRNIVKENKTKIKYNEQFYLLAYILPYELENGGSSHCIVEKDGKDIENWGKKFGIKHYLTFQMKFE